MALNAYARAVTDRVVDPVGRRLARAGVSANALTVFGLAVSLGGLVVILAGAPFTGAVILAVGVVTDAFDGAVARARGTQGPFGSFFDSVTDRVADAAMLATAAWLVREEPVLFAVAMVAMAGAQLTSYIRAKAESLGWAATVGILERAERAVIMVVGFAFDLVAVALWILAAGAVVTVAQRWHVVRKQARPGRDRRGTA